LLGKAVVEYVKEQRKISNFIEPKNFVSHPGLGIVCTVDKKEVIVGNRKLLLEKNVLLEQNVEEKLIEFEMAGKT
jgi:Cu+-exporting ATPase